MRSHGKYRRCLKRKVYVDNTRNRACRLLMPYPWHTRQWQQARLAVEQGRLAHAVLLSGAEGCGIRQFAIEFARYLLCEADTGVAACGQCRSCLLFDAGNHPDMLVVDPEDNGTQIKVEAVRELIAYLQLSNHYGRYKIVVIEPAEGMNRHSANSLLKTLEEPAPSTLLMLVSYQTGKLPVTIRSRCRKISFNGADPQSARAWLGEQVNDPEQADVLLELSGGAPLKALQLNETDAVQIRREILADLQAALIEHADPVKLAEKWQKHDAVEVLAWLLFLFSKMAAMRCTEVAGDTGVSFIDRELRLLGNGLDLTQVIGCYDLVLKNHQFLTGEYNLNKQGLLEEIIVHWQSIRR